MDISQDFIKKQIFEGKDMDFLEREKIQMT